MLAENELPLFESTAAATGIFIIKIKKYKKIYLILVNLNAFFVCFILNNFKSY